MLSLRYPVSWQSLSRPTDNPPRPAYLSGCHLTESHLRTEFAPINPFIGYALAAAAPPHVKVAPEDLVAACRFH